MKYLIILFVAVSISGCAADPKMDDWKAIMSAPSPRYAPMPMVIINTPQPVNRGEYPAFNNLHPNNHRNANYYNYIQPCLTGNCY